MSGRNFDGTITTWTYDAANRLVSQTVSGAIASYTMDALGNLTVKHHQGSNPMTFTYDAASQMVTMLQGSRLTTYTFDSNGNQTLENTAGTRVTHTYDMENRNITIDQLVFGLSTNTYDGDGLRRANLYLDTDVEPPATKVVTFIWDGSDYLGEVGP